MTVVKGKIKDFGEAPYKHDNTKQLSYFVNIETENGSRTLWSVGLKDAINNADLKKGDFAALADKGTQSVRVPNPKEPGNYIDTKKRIWDVEAFEPDIEHKNSIENGVELKKDQQQYQDSDYDHNVQARKSKFADIDDDALEQELPSTIKNNYIAKVKNRYFASEKVHFYERDSEDTTVAFEDRNKTLNTSREDVKTIKAMIDVAQAKNWSSIKIKGTEAFRREAWLEANIRGLEVKGYTPNEKDLVELEKRKTERSTNQILGDEDRSRELNSKREDQHKLFTKEEDKNVGEHAKDASAAVAIDASLAVATGGKYTAAMAATSIITDKAQSLAFDKLAEKFKLSEKVSELTTEKESQVWNAEVLAEEYNLPKDKAEALFIEHPSQVDLEEHIASMQEEYDVDRESSIEGLANMAMDGRYDDPDLDDKVWQSQLDGWDKQDARRIAEFEAQHESDKQINKEYNNKYYVEDLEHDAPTTLSSSEKFLKGVHIRDNQTGENYQLVAFEVEYMGEKSYGLTAEHYVDDEHYARHEHNAHYDAQDFTVINKIGLGWEFNSTTDNFKEIDKIDASYLNDKLIEREAFVRSNEFNAGRDVDPDPGTEVNAEVEQFHDNLAVPTGTKMSHSEAMRKVEAAFDRKINPGQRNEIKELEEKLSNEQKLAVESWRRVVDERFKDDPTKRQEKHDALDAKIPGIVAGEYKLEAPTIKEEQQIQVQTRDKGSQDRVR